MTDEKQAQRGKEAQMLMDNPIFNEGWMMLRQALLTKMETAKSDEASLHAKVCLGLMGDLRRYWDRVVTDGKVSAATILEEAEKKQRKRS